MFVDVATMRRVSVAVMDEIGVLVMRDRLVPASVGVHVAVVSVLRVSSDIIPVVRVCVMNMSVVQIVSVVRMHDSGVSAVARVLVRMVLVDLVFHGHR